MRTSSGVIALLLTLLSAGPAPAAPVLTMQPVGSSSIGVGGTVNFDLMLLNPDAVIGAFSVDIAFDPSVLHLGSAAALGVSLGDVNLLEAIGTVNESSSGILHIDEVSLLDTASLEALQGAGVLPASLRLASFSFEGMLPGSTSLAFLADSVQFGDATGTALNVPALQPPGPVTVIPEPASAALVLLALAVSGVPGKLLRQRKPAHR